MDARKFSKFMNKKDNILKDSRNKSIIRKMHQSNEDKSFKDTTLSKHFSSAWSVRNQKRLKPESKDVD